MSTIWIWLSLVGGLSVVVGGIFALLKYRERQEERRQVEEARQFLLEQEETRRKLKAKRERELVRQQLQAEVDAREAKRRKIIPANVPNHEELKTMFGPPATVKRHSEAPPRIYISKTAADNEAAKKEQERQAEAARLRAVGEANDRRRREREEEDRRKRDREDEERRRRDDNSSSSYSNPFSGFGGGDSGGGFGGGDSGGGGSSSDW